MTGPLSSANREIREAEEREHARKLALLKRPRRLTDQLLSQLEELNLEEVQEVPLLLGPPLADLVESVREWPQIERRFGARLRPGVRTSELIDTIFAIQEILAPPTRRSAIDADAGLLAIADEPGWTLKQDTGH